MTKVWDGRLLREVALKTLRPEARGLAQRFLREARITAQLEHPNIVPVYDLDDAELPSFTMREIRGASLAERIEAGTLGRLGARLDIFRKVCDAIAYAHDCGVVHRDLKPSNVMVGRFGEVQVVDWGLARVSGEPDSDDRIDVLHGSDDRTRVGSISGTPMFMAPEQGVVDGTIDERTDVYGLGRLLACLLAGRAVRTEEPTEGPWELAAVVARATAEAPGDRYPNVLEMQADIEAYQDDQPLPSLRYTPASRAMKSLWRHRAVALASSLTGLAAGVVLAIAVYTQATAHVAQLQEARDAAIAATLRAEHQLARAQLALAWSAAEGGEPAAARDYLDEAARMWGDHPRVELDLADAWLGARVGRPSRRIHWPDAIGGRYGPDGQGLVVSTPDGVVIDHDGVRRPLGPGNSRAWLAAGVLATAGGRMELRALDGTVRWARDLSDEYTVAMSHDQRILGVASADGAVLLDAATGDELRSLPGLSILHGVAAAGERVLGSPVDGSTHKSPSTTLLVDANDEVMATFPGSALARLSADGQRVLWTDEAGVTLSTIDGRRARTEPTSRHTALYVLGDGRALIWNPNEARRFDLDGPVERLSMPRAPQDLRPDGEAMLVKGPEGLEEWPLLERRPLRSGAGAITDLALSPEGELLAAVGWAGSLEILDVATGRILLSRDLDPKGLRAVDWSPDGTHLVVGGRSGQALEVDLGGDIRWRSAQREALAMDVHYTDDGLLIGWEDGSISRWEGGVESMGAGPAATLWALAPGEPLVSTARGDLDPAFVRHDGQPQAPQAPGYGIERLGDRVAAGTGWGVSIADLDTTTPSVDLEGPTIMDVAFLGPDVVLGAGYEGRVHVWLHEADGWRATHPFPLGEDAVLTSITTRGDDIWVGDGQGVLHHLRLHDGQLLPLRDALRHRLAPWLEAQDVDGIDLVRVQATLGHGEEALDATTDLDGPAATLWRNDLSDGD